MPLDAASDFESYDLSEFSSTELHAVDRVSGWLLTRPYSYAHATYCIDTGSGSTQVQVHETGRTGTATIATYRSSDTEPGISTCLSSPLPDNDFLDSRRASDVVETVSTGTECADTTLLLRDDSLTVLHRIDALSPYDLFRARYKVLSVSDLVAPVWCEVQFDYKLRQRGGSGRVQRADEFLSAQNKRIRVNKNVAARNSDTMRGGSIVHENLERRFRPEPSNIPVANDNERWALRLLRMIACLNDLQDRGICREMPTFGMLHGHIVNGVIDEVGQHAVTNDTGLTSANTSMVTPFHPAHHVQETPTEDSTFTSSEAQPITLHLSDTKTRRRDDLPSEPDSLPARLQLMTYRRLLSDVISASFPWGVFWGRLNIDPSEVLDNEFLACASQCISMANLQKLTARTYEAFPDNLALLVHIFQTTIRGLQIVNVSPTLSIVYRSQRSVRARQLAVEEAVKLQAILEAQLMEEDGAIPELARLVAENMVRSGHGFQFSSSEVPVQDNDNNDNEGSGSRIIGVTTFVADDDLLESHLNSVFAWWMGNRPPEGVSAENTRRCHGCEYMEDCEWRESKVAENDRKFGITR